MCCDSIGPVSKHETNMRTKRSCGLLLAASVSLYSLGQTWQAGPGGGGGGNVINTTEYLGARAGSTVPVRIKTIPGLPIEFYTNDVLRMRLSPTGTNTINGFAGVTTSGFVGMAANNSLWTLGAATPFSRLHLHDGTGTPQQAGYRTWMKNGISLTGNSDNMYMGQKYGTTDVSDAVMSWSDNPGPTWGDRMRFIFTSTYTGAATGNGSAEGLEGMRMKPSSDGSQIYVGVGDFFAGGTDPDERLHVLTGGVKVSQLPTVAYQAPTTDDDKVVVVRANGLLNWRDAATLGGDCDWMVTPGATGNHVWTATGVATANCPDAAENVGIGTAGPAAKLTVIKTVATGGGFNDVGGSFFVGINGGTKSALDGAVLASGTTNYGLRVTIDGANWNYGVHSKAGLGVVGGKVTSGYFLADGELGTLHDDIIAVHGVAINNNSGGPGWAAYFEGDGYLANLPWSTSDEALKQDEEVISNALDALLAIPPKTYQFDTEAFGFMGLAPGQQSGVMASDVEAVLPHLVRTIHRPADIDSLGNEVHPAMDFKAVSYLGLIPYLIGAVQELKQGNDALAAIVANCCALHDDGTILHNLENTATSVASTREQGRLLVHPNPFTKVTTIALAVEMASAVTMVVMSAKGELVTTLELGKAPAGIFTYEWNTGHLAAGQYIITLLLNGQPEVAHVVKLVD